MRNGLLLPDLADDQRRSLETDFRTTLGLASEDLESIARSLRSGRPAAGSVNTAGLVFRVGVCLLALLIATLLIIQEIAVVRFRPAPYPEEEPASAPESPEAPIPENLQVAERLAERIALRFNQLLTPINGYCELLLDSLAPADPARGDIEEIRKAGRKAAILSRQLQAFGRQEDSEPRALDFNDWIEQQRDRLRSLVGEATSVELELESSAGVVRADPRQLQRILDALSLNAADAMPEGGTLRIRTAPIHRESSGALALLEISDTGIGMDEETQSRLFEPLFSTKTPGRGAGLSLATVRGTVERLGGSIEVASEPGLGATFRVYLPRLVEVPADPVPPKSRAAHA
jgi:signal transduction histidine kinase